MNLVTMVLACSLYSDHSLVYAMAQVGSQNNPLVVTAASASKTFKTEQEAISETQKQLAQGENVDIGLMQIPSRWLQPFAAHASDLFRPCKNMVLATQILDHAHQQCLSMQSQPVGDIQACTLSRYKTDNPQDGLTYAQAVLDYAKKHPFSELEKKARDPDMAVKKKATARA